MNQPVPPSRKESTSDARRGRRQAAHSGAELSRLLEMMRTGRPEEVEEAWSECFRQYHERVWTRVFFVVRTIHWLKEPREVAADLTGQVFLGLPDAVRKYRELGKPEQWLLQVAMRTALRHKESITGQWSSGKKHSGGDSRPGRAYLSLDDLVQELEYAVDAAERDERLELQRRLEGWQNDRTKRKYLPHIELFIQGYNHDEIAEKLGITPGTSRTWLWQIRQHLAEGLEGEVTRHDEEVTGRGAERPVISILPRLDRHLELAALRKYADAPIEGVGTDRIEQHLARCELCAGTVYSLRLALAILATASSPPAELLEVVRHRRRAGERVMLKSTEQRGSTGAESYEVAGRELGPRGEKARPDPKDADRP